jgi:hypothetical protein
VARGGGSAGQRRPERRRRPLPDEGGPDNPVIDEGVARMLRERLGGDQG